MGVRRINWSLHEWQHEKLNHLPPADLSCVQRNVFYGSSRTPSFFGVAGSQPGRTEHRVYSLRRPRLWRRGVFYQNQRASYRSSSRSGGYCVSEYGAGGNVKQHEQNPRKPKNNGRAAVTRRAPTTATPYSSGKIFNSSPAKMPWKRRPDASCAAQRPPRLDSYAVAPVPE